MKIKWPWQKKRPCYVIVYDVTYPQQGEAEEYYGYFSSPEEARKIWATYTLGTNLEFRNVKLCKIVEDW